MADGGDVVASADRDDQLIDICLFDFTHHETSRQMVIGVMTCAQAYSFNVTAKMGTFPKSGEDHNNPLCEGTLDCISLAVL